MMKNDLHLAIDFGGDNTRSSEVALGYFVKLHTGELKRHALKIVHDSGIADDMVAEAFIRLWNRRSGFSHPKVIRSWLFIVVQNLSYNYIQKEKSRIQNESKLSKIFTYIDYFNGETEMVNEEESRSIRHYLSKLPKECERILFMMYGGMKAREISEILNLSVSTVKNQFARGKTLLINMMKGGCREMYKPDSDFVDEQH